MSDDDAISHRDELMLLYQVTVSDLTYFKSQQWSITNYAFLLLAAVAGLRQMIGPSIVLAERLTLTVLAAVVAVGGLTMLFKLQQSIRVRQARLDAVRLHLSPTFNAAWAAELKGPEYFHSIWFLRGAIVMGAAIVTWVVFRI